MPVHLDLVAQARKDGRNLGQNLDQLGFQLGRRGIEQQVLAAVQNLDQEPLFGDADLDLVPDVLEPGVFAHHLRNLGAHGHGKASPAVRIKPIEVSRGARAPIAGSANTSTLTGKERAAFG